MFHVKHSFPHLYSFYLAFFVEMLYYFVDATNKFGIKSGSGDSSFNIFCLCASFFVGDFMKNDEYFMKMALIEAKKAYKLNEVPVGAVIVLDGEVIASGYNCKESTCNALTHAEMIAISKACGKLNSWRLDNCILYTTMEPCAMCLGAIIESRIPIVICAIPRKNEQMFLRKELKLTTGVCKEESLNLVQKFFKNLRNKD